jgi:hypothetical protein
MPTEPHDPVFPGPDRPLGALRDDINGLVAYLTLIVPLGLLLLAVVVLARPL